MSGFFAHVAAVGSLALTLSLMLAVVALGW